MNGTTAAAGVIRSEFADDPDFADLIESFLESVAERGQALRVAFSKQAWNEIRVTAHQLKGAGGGYGFPELSILSADLEAACYASDTVRIGVALTILLEHLDRMAL